MGPSPVPAWRYSVQVSPGLPSANVSVETVNVTHPCMATTCRPGYWRAQRQGEEQPHPPPEQQRPGGAGTVPYVGLAAQPRAANGGAGQEVDEDTPSLEGWSWSSRPPPQVIRATSQLRTTK